MKRAGIYILGMMVLALLSAGCTGMSAEQIAEKVQQKYEQIEDYQGTMVTLTTQTGEGNLTMIADFKHKKPDKYRLNMSSGMVSVSNGTTVWTYSPEENEVRILTIKGREEQPETDFGNMVKDMMEKYDVELLGSEEISDRDCYVLKLTPKEEGNFLGTQKLWVDKEYWMPIKIETEMKANGKTVKSSVLYRDIEFNTGIPDSAFEFEVPEGAKVVREDMKMPEKLGLGEAQKEVDFEILVPEYVPEGHELEYATHMEIKGEQRVSLRYRGSDGTFSLSEKPAVEGSSSLPGSEEVDINGTKGEMKSMGKFYLLKWECNGLRLSLSGGLSKEDILRVARSVECGG